MDRRKFIKYTAFAASAVGVIPLAFTREVIDDDCPETATSEMLDELKWSVRISPEHGYAKQVIAEQNGHHHAWIIEQKDGPISDDECIEIGKANLRFLEKQGLGGFMYTNGYVPGHPPPIPGQGHTVID